MDDVFSLQDKQALPGLEQRPVPHVCTLLIVCIWESRRLVWVRGLCENEGHRAAVPLRGHRGRRLQVSPWFPGWTWRPGTLQEQHLSAASASKAWTPSQCLPPHVHKAHGDQACLQVCEHDHILPDLCRWDHWQLHSAEDHIQEQVYEEWTQCLDWQPGTWRPALYHHCHTHQCVQGNNL